VAILADYAQRETTKREHIALIRKQYGSNACLMQDTVLRLRRAKINYPLKMDDGTIYSLIGGGFSVNGKSSEVVDLMLNAKTKIIKWQKMIEMNSQNIIDDALSKEVILSDKHGIILFFDGLKSFAVEKNNLFNFELGVI